MKSESDIKDKLEEVTESMLAPKANKSSEELFAEYRSRTILNWVLSD